MKEFYSMQLFRWLIKAVGDPLLNGKQKKIFHATFVLSLDIGYYAVAAMCDAGHSAVKEHLIIIGAVSTPHT